MFYTTEYKSTVTIKDKETKEVVYKERLTIRNANTVTPAEAKERFRNSGKKIAEGELGYAPGEYLLSASAPKEHLYG